MINLLRQPLSPLIRLILTRAKVVWFNFADVTRRCNPKFAANLLASALFYTILLFILITINNATLAAPKIFSFINSNRFINNSATDNHNYSDWLPAKSCNIPHDFYNTADTIDKPDPAARSSYLCGGCYQQPSYQYELTDKKKYPTNITSDSGEFISKGDSTFFGNVVATQGNRTIFADKAIVSHHPETGELEKLHAIGNFTLTEPGIRIDGDQADVFYKEDKKIIYNAKYRIYAKHAHGRANKITTYGKTKMVLPKADYTTCAPHANSWRLRSHKARFNRDTGRGESWHTRLYIKNVPIFYWPYLNFPIDDRRQTGFLQPIYRHSSINGDSITTPFYLNLAPNYDATITPHFISRRRLKVDNRFRYLTQHSYSRVQFNFLPNDKQHRHFVHESFTFPNGIGVNDLRHRGLRESYQRYGLAIDNHTDFNKNLFLDLNYSRVGDDNYIYDFGDDFRSESIVDPSQVSLIKPPTLLGQENYANSTALLQQVTLTSRSNYGDLLAKMNQYQTLHPFLGPSSGETYRRLPELDFQSRIFDLPQDLETRFTANATVFKIREVPDSAAPTTGKRYHARPELSYPITEPGWFIKPRIQYDMVTYRDMKLAPTDVTAGRSAKTARGIPLYDLDNGLIFERSTTLNKTNYFQTLEPRAYFLYVPDRDQTALPVFDSGAYSFDYSQVFRDNRYGGRDRVSDAKHVSLGVYNRFLTVDTGAEKASFGIGRIYYLRDRTLHLPETFSSTDRWSPLAAVANYQIRPYWNVTANLVRVHLNKTQIASLMARYQPSSVHVINFGYEFSRNDAVDANLGKPLHLKAAKFSSAWELSPQLRLLGKLDYDLNLKRSVETLAGLEVHTCCTITRIAWSQRRKPSANLLTKEYDYVLLLQFVFKGLAGTNSLDQIIRAAIPGYNPQDHEF